MQVIRFILRKVIEFIKLLDDALLVGQYNLNPFMPQTLSFDLDDCNDEDHN